MIKKTSLLAAVTFGVVALAGSAAEAQSVRLLGDYRDWSSYAASEGDGAMCFAMSKPKDVEPKPDGYTQSYLYVTHRPSEKLRNEFNLVAGFNFAPDTPASISVGGTSYELFTENDAAWLKNPAESESLAGVMRAGSSLIVEGTTDKGIKVKESFSLSGATAAAKAIDGECS